MYDCIYLTMSHVFDIPLVTADRALIRMAEEAGMGQHVLWVEDVVER